jgi:hypothetical protein
MFLPVFTAGPLCLQALHLPTGCAVLRSSTASPGQGRQQAHRYPLTPPTAPRHQQPAAQQHHANNDNDNDHNDNDNDRQPCRAARAEGRSAAASEASQRSLHPTRIAP